MRGVMCAYRMTLVIDMRAIGLLCRVHVAISGGTDGPGGRSVLCD